MDNFGQISTPKNKCRQLGLRRTIERPNKPKTPLSDVKISYKSLQNNAPSPLIQCTTDNVENHTPVSSTPSTPCLLQNKIKKAHTINSLPSRLSLGCRPRERYRKKKLEFTVTGSEAELDKHRDACSKAITQVGTSNDPLQETIESEIISASQEKHQNKVKELKALIEIWKEAFKTSLEDLSSKMEPKMDTEDLLDRLGIPPEMIEYT